MELFELERRTNFHHYNIESAYFLNDLILYDDHRCLLNILFELSKHSEKQSELASNGV